MKLLAEISDRVDGQFNWLCFGLFRIKKSIDEKTFGFEFLI